MTDVVLDPTQLYHVAATERRDDRTRVLKHADTFAVFDAVGDASGDGPHEQGLYHLGTRHVSTLELRVDGYRPLLLSSTLLESSEVLTVDLTNPDMRLGDDRPLANGQIHLHRLKFLWEATCYEQIVAVNYGQVPLEVSLELRVEADFADIFEVRGTRRLHRGRRLPTLLTPDGLVYAYQGLDGVTRQTAVSCAPAPRQGAEGRLYFDLTIGPRETADVYVAIECDRSREQATKLLPFGPALAAVREATRINSARCPKIETADDMFDRWMTRSRADVYLMVTDTSHGPYPYAGIPWFSTPFGRDGLITALSMLWADPTIARGVLNYLAATQAIEEDPARDAQPGKILHESRDGEMAALGEVPFGRYYGSVDSTPLFVLVAGRYFDRTGDTPFLRQLWPHIEAALHWIDHYGDVDGDGLVEYARQSDRGLVQQGWKDSHDSVFHADGTPADGPIALCEVQGYVYAAKHHAAELASRLGHAKRARQLRQQAEKLHRQFERQFWSDALGCYVIALDGRKRPCEVVSSNAGQCLISGIALPDHAQRQVATLFGPEMFSGWGIRTIRASESRYNPMSYHNGSVWPHDTALIASGLARYGYTDRALQLVSGLLDAASFFELGRLPELFCGFARRPGEGPTRYPVACSPQAWAAAAGFQLVQSMLGLSITATDRRVCFTHPRLPDGLDWLRISNLQVDAGSVDLLCERRGEDVAVTVLRRTGQVNVTTAR
jgi:glycogen debranching enzyme